MDFYTETLITENTSFSTPNEMESGYVDFKSPPM